MNATSWTLREIASTHPAATRVFLRHRLDFCCGGQRTLSQACQEAGLDPSMVAREIASGPADPRDAVAWEQRSPAELADHIEQHYHAELRRDLPALIAAARKVEGVHAGKPQVPDGLANLLDDLWEDMQQHMMKEERILFPMLRQGARGDVVFGPVRVMENEHQEHGQVLKSIRALTGDFVPPDHACATWRALYSGLARLEEDLMRHIHLENNVLFLRAVLDE